jgi:hypothetical protein
MPPGKTWDNPRFWSCVFQSWDNAFLAFGGAGAI